MKRIVPPPRKVSYQLRLSDDLYAAVSEFAKQMEVSVCDVVRDALELHVIACERAAAGQRLYAIDPETGERTELLFPPYAMLQRKARRGRSG